MFCDGYVFVDLQGLGERYACQCGLCVPADDVGACAFRASCNLGPFQIVALPNTQLEGLTLNFSGDATK